MQDPDQGSYEQIIGGRYALYGPIASGGMATVHFGRQLGAGGFSRTVAIKRLRGEFLESFEFISTLLDEARLASRIRHPNVVATLDMVAAEDEVFLVMEYVVGESLSRLLAKLQRSRRHVLPKIATGVLCGVLHALHAAHEAVDERGEPLGIVHRDVSPQNVLVGTDGLARLLDFGIAKGKGRLQTTRAGQLKGKVSYMAPEQILGEEPDRRSDVYAAAVVLWEVLTGRRLFPTDAASDNYRLIPKILEADIAPPSSVADVPLALDAIVMRGLNRQRDARYPTARDFAVALEDTVGVATNRQIGEWVAEVAAQELAERAELLKALEASTTAASQHSVSQLADAAASRQRRKRLSSRPEAPRKDRLDEPTEVDDTDTEENTLKRSRPESLDTLRREQAAVARVRELERAAVDVKAQTATVKDPRRIDEETVSLRRRVQWKQPEGDEQEDLRETTQWRRDDLAPRPSDFRPSTEPPPSEEIVLPVTSNRWVMLVLVLAALAVGAAAAMKMFGKL